jgi:hypothetical protein
MEVQTYEFIDKSIAAKVTIKNKNKNKNKK